MLRLRALECTILTIPQTCMYDTYKAIYKLSKLKYPNTRTNGQTNWRTDICTPRAAFAAENCPFFMENCVQPLKTLIFNVKWAFSDKWVKKMAIFLFWSTPVPMVTFLGLKITQFLKMRFFKHPIQTTYEEIFFLKNLKFAWNVSSKEAGQPPPVKLSCKDDLHSNIEI